MSNYICPKCGHTEEHSDNLPTPFCAACGGKVLMGPAIQGELIRLTLKVLAAGVWFVPVPVQDEAEFYTKAAEVERMLEKLNGC